jgi:Zn-dependent protease with chaperone function
MNFFESQDRVRRNTFLLVILFGLAVITMIVMVNLLVMAVSGYFNSQQMADGGTFFREVDWRMFAAVSVGVSLVVLAGSLYKMVALSSGGKVVAESLGGQLIARNTDNPMQRKLLNVVDEMAVASGTPAPPVYLLANQPGINAFAAGFSSRDAVIGVTQGAIDHLSREQLQGVIAHEFSHIFNGDMRLNIRLMGVLNGILILGIIGYYLMYSASFSRRGRSSDKGAAAILALAIGLMAIGFTGTFFGGLIKAAVSRQREYLADASAVQFTRNPEGIAGALKRIGGLEFGSKVDNPGASEVSHAFFAQGISGFMQAIAATHPPLAKRIRQIDPDWDGKFYTSDRPDTHQNTAMRSSMQSINRGELASKVVAVAAGVAVGDIANAIDTIGKPNLDVVDHARSLIDELPEVIAVAAHEPYGSRALMYGLLLDRRQEVRGKQLEYLQKHADPDVMSLMHKLLSKMANLESRHRLPILDIAIPALKQLSLDQYIIFRANIVALIEMDSRVDLLEWTLHKILSNHLDAQFYKVPRSKSRYSHLGQIQNEISLLLSAVAYAGEQNQQETEAAFRVAGDGLECGGLQLIPRHEVSFSELDQALHDIGNLNLLVKPQLLEACASIIMHDQKATANEMELLRAISDTLGCPMPPIISTP